MTDRFDNWEYPEIIDGHPTRYHWIVQGVDGFTLGYKTDIGAFCYIQAKEGVVIEDFVQVGSHCAIYSVSTIDGKKGRVVLKESCCIGSHSTILPGVTIGKNAVVGAHSLVNKDIPDNVVAFGCPAEIIRSLEK
jgi:acetyltransferase-like isoleucine patch superfamily enzyme